MKGKRQKVIVVFDEKDRRDFLTGFRKRKNARRKKALEENRKKEEEARKQQREEKREALRRHVEEYENQQVNEDLVQKPESITHDFGEHTVTVSTITDEDMGRDFLTCANVTQSHPKTTECRTTSENHKRTTKEKLLRKRQFHKKAQKRKIQAMSDKKSLKQKKRGRQK